MKNLVIALAVIVTLTACQAAAAPGLPEPTPEPLPTPTARPAGEDRIEQLEERLEDLTNVLETLGKVPAPILPQVVEPAEDLFRVKRLEEENRELELRLASTQEELAAEREFRQKLLNEMEETLFRSWQAYYKTPVGEEDPNILQVCSTLGGLLPYETADYTLGHQGYCLRLHQDMAHLKTLLDMAQSCIPTDPGLRSEQRTVPDHCVLRRSGLDNPLSNP